MLSTTSLNEDKGTEISYLYGFPSLETASVTPSRRAHSDENCAGLWARIEIGINEKKYIREKAAAQAKAAVAHEDITIHNADASTD